MDPRRLMTFRAVAHAGSFSRAAETMSLTQPSVSHQIALLETEIGVRLLERGRGGLRLTAAGAVLLEHADQVAWRLELADTQLASLARQRRESAAAALLPPEEWHIPAPDVEDVEHHGVLVHGMKDAPSAMAVHASQLYARNVVNLLLLMTTDGEVVPDFDDEIVAAACVTRKEPA